MMINFKRDITTFLTKDWPYLLGLLVLYSYIILTMWVENVARQDPWTDIFKNCAEGVLPLIFIQLIFHGLLHLNKSWWKKATRVSVRFFFGLSLIACSITMFPVVLLAEYCIGEGPGELFDLSWNDFPFFLTVSRPVAIWLFWWLILVEQKQLAIAQYNNMRQQHKYHGYALLHHRLKFIVQYFVQALSAIKLALITEASKVLTLLPEIAQIFRSYLMQPARLFNNASEALDQLEMQLNFNKHLADKDKIWIDAQIDSNMLVPTVVLPGFVEQVLLTLMTYRVNKGQILISGHSSTDNSILEIVITGCCQPGLYLLIFNCIEQWEKSLPENMLLGYNYQIDCNSEALRLNFNWPAQMVVDAEGA